MIKKIFFCVSLWYEKSFKLHIILVFMHSTCRCNGTDISYLSETPKKTFNSQTNSCLDNIFPRFSVRNLINKVGRRLSANRNKSRLLFSSAEMFKKPLWKTVWTQIRLKEQSVLGPRCLLLYLIRQKC